jgi:ribosomal protein L16 Arg81 hydroxylase
MTTLADREQAALTARPVPGLSQLIYPIDVATFQREYWERRPLVVHREDPGYYAGLFTLDDLDQVLSLTNLLQDNIRVVMNGKETQVSELVNAVGRNGRTNALEELYARYRDGSTIVLNALEERWEPLLRLARKLGNELSARLQMNIYLTPASAQGFAAHFDTHDVFVAQAYGTKQWRTATGSPVLPLYGQKYDKSQPTPDPELEFDLRAGDIAYLPRGTIHWATSNATASVHITIGVHPVLYAQAVQDAVSKLCADDVRFRRGLPVGFASDDDLRAEAERAFTELIDALRLGLRPEDLIGSAVNRATSMALPALRHHLTDLEELGELWLDTKVRNRPDQRVSITVADEEARLEFNNKTVNLPAHVADELRYIAGRGDARFTANDIPGDLDEPGRVVLIQTLVREGLLTFG